MANLRIELSKFAGDVTKWDSWRFSLDAFLHSQGVYDVLAKQLKGEEVEVGEDDKKKLSQLYGFVISSLEGEALQSVRSGPRGDLAAVIRALDARFNSQTASMRMIALRSLLNKPKEEGVSIDAYCMEKGNLLRERLANTVSGDELLMLSALGNLPPAWAALVTPLMASDSVDYAQVKKVLVEYEASQKCVQADARVLNASSQALHTSSSSSSNSAAGSEIRELVRQELAAAGKSGGKHHNKGGGKEPYSGGKFHGGKHNGKGGGGVVKSNKQCTKCFMRGKEGHVRAKCKSPP